MFALFLAWLAVGRLLLACLPPGWPGYADRHELGATLSASWMLGSLALSLVPLWWVWALVLALRLASLPGSLRPRHGRPEGWGQLHGLLFVGALAAHFLGHEAAAALALPLGWLVTATAVWFTTADRRARALGLAALAALSLEAFA